MSSLLAKMRALLIRLGRSVRGRDGASEFDEELESDVAMHTEAGVASGLDPAEARRKALLKLGGAEQVRQAHRDRTALAWLENLGQDVRTLRRAPQLPRHIPPPQSAATCDAAVLLRSKRARSGDYVIGIGVDDRLRIGGGACSGKTCGFD